MYRYFVSYSYTTNVKNFTGTCIIEREYPVSGWDDIHNIEAEISKNAYGHDIRLLAFSKLEDYVTGKVSQ